MFFFFGWGRQTKDNLGPAMPITCPNCKNKTVWELVRVKAWFTLFFIPIAPSEDKHCLLCKVCSKGIELKGDQIEKAKEMNRLCKAYEGNQMDKEQFVASLNKIDLMEGQTSQKEGIKAIYSEKNGKKIKLCGSCETQNNPAFAQCWKCGTLFSN